MTYETAQFDTKFYPVNSSTIPNIPTTIIMIGKIEADECFVLLLLVIVKELLFVALSGLYVFV